LNPPVVFISYSHKDEAWEGRVQTQLLALDNAETIASAGRVRLLELGATTLVTSRVAIDPTTDLTVDTLSENDALALLGERGVDVAAEAGDALRLIQRLGGLALALEIKARRMACHIPRQNCAALDELTRSPNLVDAVKLPCDPDRARVLLQEAREGWAAARLFVWASIDRELASRRERGK
jgi:hypothetical protein